MTTNSAAIRIAIRATVRQSAAIHPDWTQAEHESYIVNDAFVVAEYSRTLTDLVRNELAAIQAEGVR